MRFLQALVTMAASDVESVISDVGRQYLQLQLTSDVGPVRLRNLLAHFGSLSAVLSASVRELQRVNGVGPQTAESILRARSDGAADREVDRAAECGVRIVAMEDADYPPPLRNVPDPPICLYVRGRLAATDSVAVSIVGTRRCSHYGREQAVRFGEMLGGAGFTVVSGLARGVDGCAHTGALRGGGRTVAVLGNGLSTVYPPEHEALAQEVARSGAVISELPLDSGPSAESFPRRNRIIAGLSLGVIVIEAGKGSGALITARLASEYNREVFAVPGRVDRPAFSAGVNGLIRDGCAKLITCLDDVLDELGDVGDVMRTAEESAARADEGRAEAASQAAPMLTEDERAVLDAVTEGAEEADVVASATGVELSRVMSVLTSLQLKGMVRQLPGHRFHCRERRADVICGDRS
jgi:DNA processing protein